MATVSSLLTCYIPRRFQSLIKVRTRQGLALTTALLFTISGFAQSLPTTPQPNAPSDSQNVRTSAAATITIPAGTRIALVLTHPIQSKYIHRGDDIYAQIASPVDSGNQVVIPPGTYIQGKVEKLENKSGRGILHLQSMSVTFPNGYVAPISGPATLTSDEGYAIKDPGKREIIGTFVAPATGLGLGALIGRAASSSTPTTLTTSLPPNCGVPTPGCMNGVSNSLTIPSSHLKGIAIGAMVGSAVGAAIGFALLLHSRNFYLDAGSPVEMALEQPLILQQNQVTGAVRQAERHPVAEQPIAPRPQPTVPSSDANPFPDTSTTSTCYDPGSPGTPDVDIPGTPATDDSPGTPTVHIPGIPATPPSEHPCP